jgi:hypothetical protein
MFSSFVVLAVLKGFKGKYRGISSDNIFRHIIAVELTVKYAFNSKFSVRENGRCGKCGLEKVAY